MRRNTTRRAALAVDGLEGRDLMSGLIDPRPSLAPPPAASAYIEQDNLHPSLTTRPGDGAGETRIIAILIGL